jgi:hypothetical protein
MANPILDGGGVSPQSVLESSNGVQHHALGTRGRIGERVFYYASNEGSAITRGNLCATAAPVANHVSVAWASGGAVGAYTVTVTLGATAATANQYRDGWLVAIDGTGSGQYRKIKSHPAAGSAATLELTLYDPIETAFVAADEITLVKNQHAAVRVTPGNAAVAVAGVPAFTVPAGSTTTQYFWIQTGGPAMVLGDGSTFVAGECVTFAVAGTADAGQVTITTGTTTTGQPLLGYIIDLGDASSDLDYRFVNLQIRS